MKTGVNLGQGQEALFVLWFKKCVVPSRGTSFPMCLSLGRMCVVSLKRRHTCWGLFCFYSAQSTAFSFKFSSSYIIKYWLGKNNFWVVYSVPRLIYESKTQFFFFSTTSTYTHTAARCILSVFSISLIWGPLSCVSGVKKFKENMSPLVRPGVINHTVSDPIHNKQSSFVKINVSTNAAKE